MSRNCPTNLAQGRAPVRHGAKVVNQQEGGSIRVGDSIEIVVLKARDGRARIVVSAPRTLAIAATKSDGPSVGALEPSAK